ncbi:sensor domain-containing diguanylate cyclase [Alkalilimnicola sp. S0819]|uniref:sensor domain-containing diguanylate cyclase n=1 Tax=Alkalilimnicola sp. S0819 TaxID=2613922 RepID=UPI00126147F6|nr:sensor domain-containing diguanylate cyclase [Alkalilimnicola sp. S0819]KAB7623975.1 sensor domain-containing diguanylate cyclase [Alkalilimnicola sp. S0819]MPQ16577.1 diguanylate cyclase [Alkalilimnicola sp. S0819]
MDKATNPRLAAQLEELRGQLNRSEARLSDAVHQTELLRQISEAPNLDHLLRLLDTRLAALAGVDGHLIALLDSERDNLVCESLQLPDEFHGVLSTYRRLSFPLNAEDPAVDCLLKNRPRPLRLAELENAPGTTATRLARWRMEAAYCLPIALGERAIGIAMLLTRQATVPPPALAQAEELLRLFRHPLAKAAHHQHLREKEEQLNRAAEAQREFLRFIAEVNNLTSTDSIYDLISREFLDHFPFDLVGVLTRDGEQLRLRRLSAGKLAHEATAEALRRYFSELSFDLDEADGATPMVFLKNSPLYFPDARNIRELPMSDKDRGSLDAMGDPRSIWILPIRRRDAAVGVLWLISLDAPIQRSAQEREVIDLLCSFIGTAMANAELYDTVGSQKRKIEKLNQALQSRVEELRAIAARDPLTGLGNYGTFQAELERRIKEHEREPRRGLSLLLVDVDHFKHFNDTYGHLAGNIVLQEAARRLQDCARTMDLVCRYGGEEFVLLLPKCDTEGAMAVGERIRQSFADTPFPAGREAVSVTVSVGCAQYRAGEGAASFVQRTDEALYRAKHAGRNRVERC